MMNAVTPTESQDEKEEREMPEPGTLFTKEEKLEDLEVKETVREETSSYPKFCTGCGTPTEGGNFCGNCGTKLR